MDSLADSVSADGSKLLGSSNVLSPRSLNLHQTDMCTTPTSPSSSKCQSNAGYHHLPSAWMRTPCPTSPTECHRTSERTKDLTCPDTPVKSGKTPRNNPIPRSFPKTPSNDGKTSIRTPIASPFTDTLSKSVKKPTASSITNRPLKSGKSSIRTPSSNPLHKPSKNSSKSTLIGVETPVMRARTPKDTPFKGNIPGEEQQQTPEHDSIISIPFGSNEMSKTLKKSRTKQSFQDESDIACSPNLSTPCSPFCGSAKKLNTQL